MEWWKCKPLVVSVGSDANGNANANANVKSLEAQGD